MRLFSSLREEKKNRHTTIHKASETRVEERDN